MAAELSATGTWDCLRNCSRSPTRMRSRTRYSASDSGRSLPEARDHARWALGRRRRRRRSSIASESHPKGDDKCIARPLLLSLGQVPVQSWRRWNVGSDHVARRSKSTDGSAQPVLMAVTSEGLAIAVGNLERRRDAVTCRETLGVVPSKHGPRRRRIQLPAR